MRLQFTGWLQYLAPSVVATVFGLSALVAGLMGGLGTGWFWGLTFVAAAIALLVITDLVTVRLGIHPSEAVPRAPRNLDAFELMRYRRSCRSFQPRDLSDEHRAQLLASVRRHTASDALLGSAPIRFEYVAAPLTVWPTVGAHEFLVAIAPSEYDRTAVIDVGRSLQKVVLDATREGIATCWIGPGADHQSVRADLGDRFDPARDHVICVCAVGYKSYYLPTLIKVMQFFQHRRLPISRLFFADSNMTQSLDVGVAPFDAFGRTYEACQWSPSSFNGQPTRCVGRTVDTPDGRAVRFDFIASTASRFYAPVALGIWCANWETGCGALGISGHFAATPRVPAESDSAFVPGIDASWLSEPNTRTVS